MKNNAILNHRIREETELLRQMVDASAHPGTIRQQNQKIAALIGVRDHDQERAYVTTRRRAKLNNRRATRRNTGKAKANRKSRGARV